MSLTRTVTMAAGAFAPGHLGELTRIVPFERADAVLEEARARERRVRLLPSRVGVYFVLALCLFPQAGYLGVWNILTAALDGAALAVPSQKALRCLRRRVGAARPGLRRQGDRHPRPVPEVLPGQAAAAGQPGPLGGRQALHPGPRPVPSHQPGRPWPPARVEHEYERQGALALLAALDVRTGKVFASTSATTGIAPFMALMGQVMSAEPCKNASRLFVIVDNGSDHRGKKAARRLRGAYPNAIMIRTPGAPARESPE